MRLDHQASGRSHLSLNGHDPAMNRNNDQKPPDNFTWKMNDTIQVVVCTAGVKEEPLHIKEEQEPLHIKEEQQEILLRPEGPDRSMMPLLAVKCEDDKADISSRGSAVEIEVEVESEVTEDSDEWDETSGGDIISFIVGEGDSNDSDWSYSCSKSRSKKKNTVSRRKAENSTKMSLQRQRRHKPTPMFLETVDQTAEACPFETSTTRVAQTYSMGRAPSETSIATTRVAQTFSQYGRGYSMGRAPFETSEATPRVVVVDPFAWPSSSPSTASWPVDLFTLPSSTPPNTSAIDPFTRPSSAPQTTSRAIEPLTRPSSAPPTTSQAVDPFARKRPRPEMTDYRNGLLEAKDEDEYFCLSLVPACKRMTPRNKAHFKIKIMQLVAEYEFEPQASSVDSDTVDP